MIEVHVDTRTAEEALRRIGQELDRRVYLTLVGQRMLAWFDDNFKRHGAEQPWKPLSPNTIAARRGGGAGAQPLRDTGRMAQSAAFQVGADFVKAGFTDHKAIWHHAGTAPREILAKKKGGVLRFIVAGRQVVYRRRVQHPGIPARPLLPSQSLAELLGQRVLDAYVEELTRRVG